MTFYVTDQNLVVFSLTVLGAAAGLLWDVCGCMGRSVKVGYVISNIAELLFCLLFAFVYHITVFVTNYGYVRWYEFAGAFFGVALYKLILSEIVTKAFTAVISVFARVIVKIVSAVIYPFAGIAEVLLRLLKKYVLCKLCIKMTEVSSRITAGKQIALAAKGFPCREERMKYEQRIQKAGSTFQSHDDIYNNRTYNNNNRPHLKNKRVEKGQTGAERRA